MRSFIFNPGVPSGGLNNCDDETLIKEDQLSACQNVIFDENQFIQKRPSITVGPGGSGNESRTHSAKMGKNYYTFKKKDGSIYQIVFTTGPDSNNAPTGIVMYSTDTKTWTLVYSGFNPNYQLQFGSFADKLIMTNGIDDVRYWSGPGSNSLKIGQVGLTLVSGGSMTAGLHSFKVTYEKESITYSYQVPNDITTDGSNATVTISNIPLPPDVADTANRKIWMTKVGDNTVYYLLPSMPITDNSVKSITFNQADATLGIEYSTLHPVSVQCPKGRFFEVFDNRPFFAHTTDGPSEAYWGEVGDFENYLPFSVLATTTNADRANETLNDGEYCSGLKFFKGMNQLLLFKKTGLYIIFPVSDRYDFRSISPQGCTLDGSIQEFHIEDERESRDSIIYANSNAIWEYTGHTVHEISRQPNRSSITATFKKIKQRFADYKKNIKTTYADFAGADYNNGVVLPTGEPNYATPETGGFVDLENLFDWKTSGITDLIKCFCYDNVLKRLYAIVPTMAGSSSGDFVYYVWDAATKTWGGKVVVQSSLSFGDTIKMVYDNTTGCIVGMQLFAGHILTWKTGNPITGVANVKDICDFTEGATTLPKTRFQAVAVEKNHARAFNFCGALKYEQLQTASHIMGVQGIMYTGTVPSSSLIKENYFYVPEYSEVFNPSTGTVYLKKDLFIDGPINTTPPYDYLLTAGSSQYVKPGLYCVWSYIEFFSGSADLDALAEIANGGPNIPKINLYYKSPINIQMEAMGGVVYLVKPVDEAVGSTTFVRKTVISIDIVAWPAPSTVLDAAYGYVFLKPVGSTLYTSFTSLITNSVNANGVIHKLTSGIGSFVFNDTDTFPKAFAVAGTTLHGYAFNLSYGGYKYFDMKVPTYNLILLNVATIDLGVNKTLGFYSNPDKVLFYHIRPDGFVYEYSPVSGEASLVQPAAMIPFMLNASDFQLTALANVGSGATTSGRHRFKFTFTKGGKHYVIKDDINIVSNGKQVDITGLNACIGVGVYSDRTLWVSSTDVPSGTYYKLNNAALGDTATTATFNSLDAAVTGWTLLDQNETTYLHGDLYYDICILNDVYRGTPSMLMTSIGAGDATYRGITGTYKIQGDFIFTNTSAFDTTTDGSSLLTMEIDQTIGAHDILTYGLFTTPGQISLPRGSTPWFNIDFLSTGILEGHTIATGPGGSAYFGLAHGDRYVHEYVQLVFDVGAECPNSSTWNTPSVNSIVVNYITVKGGSTIPVTNVTSAVLGKYYYLAVTLPVNGNSTDKQNNVNNTVLVLDRLKRWTVWRSNGLHPASFAIVNDVLRWTDAMINAAGDESDFIYSLTERDNNIFADMVIDPADASVALPQAIDAWYITKNFRRLAPWDTALYKKHIRHIYATAIRDATLTGQNLLTIGINFDESKIDDGTGNMVDAWTEKQIDLTATDAGKKNKNVDFPAGTSGYRIRYRFRNNQLYKDLSMIDYEVTGFTLHRRPI